MYNCCWDKPRVKRNHVVANGSIWMSHEQKLFYEVPWARSEYDRNHGCLQFSLVEKCLDWNNKETQTQPTNPNKLDSINYIHGFFL